MQLFKFEVRQDWQEFDRQKSTENIRLWWIILGGVILSTASNALITSLQLGQSLEIGLRILLSFGFFFVVPLWMVIRADRKAPLYVAVILLSVACAAILSGLTLPLPGSVPRVNPVFSLPVQAALVVPVIGWLVMGRTYRRFPGQLKRLGFTTEYWPINMLVGVVSGGIIGFHFLLSTYLIAHNENLFPAQLPITTWAFLSTIGLSALGEELLLRGLCFFQLYEESRSNILKAAVQIAFLNVLIYFVPLTLKLGSFWWLWVLGYHLAYSFVATFLRYKGASLIACIACNVAFHTLMATALLW